MRCFAAVCALLVLISSAPAIVVAATTTTKAPTASGCPKFFAIAFTGKDGQTYVPSVQTGDDYQARIGGLPSGSGSVFYLSNNRLYRNITTSEGFRPYLQIETDYPDDIDAGTTFVSDEYNKEYDFRNRRPVIVKMNSKTCALTFEYQDFVFIEWIKRTKGLFFYLAQDQGRPEPGVTWMLLTKAVAVVPTVEPNS